MNSKERRYPVERPAKGAMLIVLAMMLFSIPTFAEQTADSLPERPLGVEMSGKRYQQLRFRNAGLFKKIHDAIARGDNDAALEHLLDVLSQDPQNNKARIFLVQTYDKLGRYDAGIRVGQSLLDQYPDYTDLRLELAFMATKAHRADIATRLFEESLQRVPEQSDRAGEIRRNLVAAYCASGDFTRAHEHALKEVQQKEDLSLRLTLVECAARLKDWDDALRHLDAAEKITEKNPGSDSYVDVLTRKGFVAFEAGRDDVAVEALTRVLQTGKLDARRRADIHESLATVFHREGRIKEALDQAEKGLAITPTAERHLFAAECAASLNDLDTALRHLTEAEKFDQDSEDRSETFLKQGYIYYERGDFSDAERVLAKAYRATDDPAKRLTIIRDQANAAFRKGNSYEGAAALYAAYLESRFEEPVALSYLESLKRSGQLRPGVMSCGTFLSRSDISDDFRAATLKHQMYFYKALGLNQSTYTSALALIKLTRDTDALLEAAEAGMKLGLHNKACTAYELYLKHRFDPEVAMRYHYALKKKGNSAKSEAVLNRVLAVESASKEMRNEATYELAQIYRASGRQDEYEAAMKTVLAEGGEDRFYPEFASYLYGKGRYGPASDMYEKAIAAESDPEIAQDMITTLIDICLTLGETTRAHEWLMKVTDQDTDRWKLQLSRVDYREDRNEEAADRLLTVDTRTDVVNMYLGFAFYKLGMPGLALHHLDRVAHTASLPAEQRHNFFANRAYLNFDQGQYEQALGDIEEALKVGSDPDLLLVQLQAMIRLKRYREARRHAVDLLRRSTKKRVRELLEAIRTTPDDALRKELAVALWFAKPTHRASVWEIVGRTSFKLEEYDIAIGAFDISLRGNPDLSSVYHLRGLAHYRMGNEEKADEDQRMYRDHAAAVPEAFWGDFAAIKGRLEAYEEGTEALSRVVAVFPHDINSLEEAGYQYMKWGKNKEAKDSFSQAIDLYNKVIPYLNGDDRAEYTENRTNLKKEYTSLDEKIGLQAYFVKTDYNLADDASLLSIDGALPSQAGVQVSLRPPEFGFQNARTLDIFGRVLANFESDSFSLSSKSYQGGVGVRWKPFATKNVATTFERLFKIGDNAEDNWLWRVLGSYEQGEAPREDEFAWLNTRVYAEAGAFLEEHTRQYVYVDGRLGLALDIGETVILTFPQVKGVFRYETDDDSNLGTYNMIGLGMNARVFEGERDYTVGRWYADIFVHYTLGRFSDEPVSLGEQDFDGFVFGINIVK